MQKKLSPESTYLARHVGPAPGPSSVRFRMRGLLRSSSAPTVHGTGTLGWRLQSTSVSVQKQDYAFYAGRLINPNPSTKINKRRGGVRSGCGSPHRRRQRPRRAGRTRAVGSRGPRAPGGWRSLDWSGGVRRGAQRSGGPWPVDSTGPRRV